MAGAAARCGCSCCATMPGAASRRSSRCPATTSPPTCGPGCEHLFEERFHGVSVDYHLETRASTRRGSTSPSTCPRRRSRTVSIWATLEQEVAEAARTWDDRLSDALVEAPASRAGHELARRYSALFPDYYKSGVEDLPGGVRRRRSSSSSATSGPTSSRSRTSAHMAEPLTRVKLYKTGGKAPLTDLLPLLEQLGLTVVEEVPTRLQGDGGESRYLHDFGVLGPDGAPLDLDAPAATWSAETRRRRMGRPGGVRLAQPAGRRGRPLVAPGHDPARLPRVPPAARRAASRPATRTTAFVRNSGDRRPAGGSCSRRASTRAWSRDREARSPRSARRDPGRSATDVASLDDDRILRALPGHDRGHRAHQRLRPRRRAEHISVQAALRRRARACPSRCRCGRSSSTHRRWRACTCAAGSSPAAASAGQTGWRTTAPRSSG